MTHRIGEAFIEHHHDVAAQRQLNVDGRFGSEEMRIPVQMRTEPYALIGHSSQAVEAEDLKSAGIRKNGARPGHESVKTPELANRLVAGPQKQMIRVGEDDLGVDIAEEIARENPLNGRLCADRHEDRGLDVAVRRVQNAGPRARLAADSLKLESEHRFIVGVGCPTLARSRW